MPRKILVEFTFDWEDYGDVIDELMMEDAFVDGVFPGNLKEGVSAEIIKPETK